VSLRDFTKVLKEKDDILVNMSMNSNQRFLTKAVLGLALLSVTLPASAYAMDTAVWVPWFGGSNVTKSAIKNIKKIDIVYLFTYEVQSDGSLKNRANYTSGEWKKLIETAHKNKTKVIPTLAWFDGDQIEAVLSDDTARKQHIDGIASMVKDGNLDGVNIDYEQKNKTSRDDFSLFLRELKAALGEKSLTCALEARTPPDSLYKVIPDNLEYSNDYKEINKYCDWVEIMAYDQQRADLKLNDARKGVPYEPVADKDWVEKVVKLAVKDIDKHKILLGVPSYGRAWDVTVAPDWYRDYTQVASLNPTRIKYLAKKYKSPIGRTEGGEAVISYFPDDSSYKKLLAKQKVPKGTPKGFEAAAKALRYATDKNTEVSVRFVTWSDAGAVSDKITMAEKYGLKGIALFKADGEEDPGIWKAVK
jgi:spore germination protein YaaH